jgi:hypothetical protein
MGNYWQHFVGFGTVNNSADAQVLISPRSPSIQGLRIVPSLSGTQTADLLSVEVAGVQVFGITAAGATSWTITGDLALSGTLEATGATKFRKTVSITGNSALVGSLSVTGAAVIVGAVSTSANISGLSALDIGGNARVTGSLAASAGFKYLATTVVSAQQAHIASADAFGTSAATQLNLVIAALRVHGLIATG